MAKTKTKPTPQRLEPVDLSNDEPNDAINEDFDRFQNFARDIFSVPKSEIDRRAAEYDEQPKQAYNPFTKKMIPAK